MKKLNGNTIKSIKRRWAKLRLTENRNEYEMAKLLHDVFVRLDRNADSLEAFIVATLEEPRGQAARRFVRFATSFDTVGDRSDWDRFGAKGIDLLARIESKRERNKVLRSLNKTIERTGLGYTSHYKVRTTIQDVLGLAAYRSLLIIDRRDTSRQQDLDALRQYVLGLLAENPKLARNMPEKVKAAIGLNAFESLAA